MLPYSATTERRSLLYEWVTNNRSKQWYVGFVRPSGEFLTERMLWARGVFAYCPAQIVVQMVSHRRVLVRRSRPLFPRYLFVGFDDIFVFRDVAKTPMLGLLSRVEENEEEEYRVPIIIESHVVIELIDKELTGQLDFHDPNDFRVYDKVDVAIAGGITMRGVVVNLLRHRRVEVAVDMFGQKRIIKVGLAQLVRVA